MKTLTKSSRVALLFFFLLFLSQNIDAQEVAHRVYLLGNFVDAENKAVLSNQLEDEFAKTQTPFTLILNGDLVDREIGDNNHDDLIAPIRNLTDMVQKYPVGNLLIVPGDRDWNSGKRGGEKSLENLEDRVTDYFKKQDYDRCHWAVEKGCPGPEVFETGDGLVIAALNTQWWNHRHDKPRATDALCGGLTAENLKEEIEDVVEEFQDKNVLIVGHHPVESMGNYGGYFSVADQFKPFPVMGSFRTAFHANAGNKYDLANERLQVFSESMTNLFYFHENLIYASGHEHNQQVIRSFRNFSINSGAPTSAKYAASDFRTILSEKKAGIIRLNYYDDGKVEYQLLAWENAGFSTAAKNTLYHSVCAETPPKGMPNHAYTPCENAAKATEKMERKYPETAHLAAGPEYEASGWKRLWFGDHYRTSWTEEVEAPYLDLDTTFGGLKIYKKGGGRQTTSLKFKSGNGTEYTFRSVNKDPAKALNYVLRNTFAKDVIRDQTSSQAPYGSIVVASLLDEIGILHATPVLYRLPDDPKLGPFRKKYGGLFGMLEENPGKGNNEDKLFGDADKIHKSTKMFKEFYEEQKTKMNQEEMVRARLFDIYVGDWSKHEDNWKWAAYDKDGFRIYRPIPRDRDHVFSRQDGIINWLADRPFGVKNLQNFGYKISGVKSYSFQPRHMDRFVMAEADKAQFMGQAKYIQQNISNEDIERAVAKMPGEIYNLSGKVIEEKLKLRLPELDEAAEDYYSLLAKEVDIVGSKEEEFFMVDYRPDGTLSVQMFDTDKDEKGEVLLYERIFIPEETREVRLWGLGDDDIFSINGEKGKIKVRAFGGPGDDVFKDDAAAKTLLYDKGESTEYNVNGKGKVVNHWNKELYEYDRQRFEYDSYLPLIYVMYSGTRGFGVIAGLNYTVCRFQKDVYHSTHKIAAGITTEGNKSLFYNGRFHQAVRKWDFIMDASLEDPQIRNRFFGLGNDSENNRKDLGRNYYQANIAVYRAGIGVVRDFWQNSYFQLNIGLEQNESQRVENTFLAENFQNIYGAHGKLTMLPIKFSLDLDFRDGKGLPYRGARAMLSYENTPLISEVAESSNFGIAHGDIEYYLSTKKKHPLTFGLRIGGATTHGDVPWYKLPTIGSAYGLRGYVEERWTGDASAFFNTEIRYQFLKKKTSFVPIKAGVKLFYDTGRVFGFENGGSTDWRQGYGFGLYLVPLDEAITIALSIGFSDEESSGYPVFSIGKALR